MGKEGNNYLAQIIVGIVVTVVGGIILHQLTKGKEEDPTRGYTSAPALQSVTDTIRGKESEAETVSSGDETDCEYPLFDKSEGYFLEPVAALNTGGNRPANDQEHSLTGTWRTEAVLTNGMPVINVCHIYPNGTFQGTNYYPTISQTDNGYWAYENGILSQTNMARAYLIKASITWIDENTFLYRIISSSLPNGVGVEHLYRRQ